MKKNIFKVGFKAVKEEEERREQERKERQGKLWRIFFPKDADEDFEIPVRFLTDEPVCYYEHTKRVNGKIKNIPCLGDGCPECEDGDKPRFVGAFLVIDRTEFEYDERDKSGKKTGKKIKGKDRVKLLVRGQTDLAQLDRLNRKYGLLGRDWSIAKTGQDTSTKWLFDRGEVDEWTDKKIQSILPDDLKGRDFLEILQEQILGPQDDKESEEDVEEEEDINEGVMSLDEDEDEDEDINEEEERPKRKNKGLATVHALKRKRRK